MAKLTLFTFRVLGQSEETLSPFWDLLDNDALENNKRLFYEPNKTNKDIVTCISDYRRGLDWWINLLTPYKINSYLQAIQRYRWFTQFTFHRYTHTRILSLH
jgi:hypothetical protein